MPNTPEDAFKKGYGKDAYKHAKPGPFGPKEDWTREGKQVNAVRKQEYEKGLEKFTKIGLQKTGALKNVGSSYKFEKGDTLYPVLKNFYKMNNHTAFFVMVKMLKEGINVDLWNPEDEITLLNDGTLKTTRKGKSIEIKNILTPEAAEKKAAPPAAVPAEVKPSPAEEKAPPTAPPQVAPEKGTIKKGEPTTIKPPSAPPQVAPEEGTIKKGEITTIVPPTAPLKVAPEKSAIKKGEPTTIKPPSEAEPPSVPIPPNKSQPGEGKGTKPPE